jgi:hypothetical protein
MPVNCDSVLKGMVDKAPQQAETMDQQIEQIEEKQADLEEQAAAVRECVTDVARDELTTYLNDTKLSEIEALYGTPLTEPFSVVYGPNYGTIDYTDGGITDFTIVDVTGNVEYQYLGTNWDSDPTITEKISDYAFGNDYITHPVGIGAAYGLEPLVDMYEQGKSTVLGNKTKILDSVDILKKYVGL